jgi:hypothetical protein
MGGENWELFIDARYVGGIIILRGVIQDGRILNPKG